MLTFTLLVCYNVLMNNITRIPAVVVAVALAVSMTACTNNTTPAPTTSTASASPTAEPTPEPIEVAPGITVGELTQKGNDKRNTLEVTGDMSYLLKSKGIDIAPGIDVNDETVKRENADSIKFAIERIIDSPFFFSADEPTKKEQIAWYESNEEFLSEVFKADTTKGNFMASITGNLPTDPERPTKTGALYDALTVDLKFIHTVDYKGKSYNSYVYLIQGSRPVVTKKSTVDKKYNEHFKALIGMTPDPAEPGKFSGIFRNSDTKTALEGKTPKITLTQYTMDGEEIVL